MKRAQSDAQAYTDQEVGALRDSTNAALNMLSGSIRAVRTEARSGIAAAMAMGAAPMPPEPGQLAYSIQSASFAGEFATGASITYRLDTNEPLALTAGISGSRANVGVRFGVTGILR